MSLRIGVDLDGTLADLSTAYHEFEERLFGVRTSEPAADERDDAAEPTDKERLLAAKEVAKRRRQVWATIRNTLDFWTLLDPIEAGAVRRLHELTLAGGWEVFFVTQRPSSAGASVQLQSQQWLAAQGFPMPSVLTLSGSRGRAAQALDLDFLIDDLPKNCIDVISDSKCRPILVLRQPDPEGEAAARRMRIGVVPSVSAALSLLADSSTDVRPSVVARILSKLGLTR